MTRNRLLIGVVAICGALAALFVVTSSQDPTVAPTPFSPTSAPRSEPSSETAAPTASSSGGGTDVTLDEARAEESSAIEEWQRIHRATTVPRGCTDNAADPSTCDILTDLLERDVSALDSTDASEVLAHAQEVRALAAEIHSAKQRVDEQIRLKTISERATPRRDRFPDQPRYQIPDPIPKPTPRDREKGTENS